MRIVYIGTKAQKGDNVAQTGLVWKRGEILEVLDEKKAEKLLEHSNVWADADKPYELMKELVSVKTPVKLVILQADTDTFVIQSTDSVVSDLRAGRLVAQFVKPEDLASFRDWQDLDKQTKPDGLEPVGKKKAA